METKRKRDDFTALVLYLCDTDLKEYAFSVLKNPREERYIEIQGSCASRSDAEELADWTIREAFRRRDEFDQETGIEGMKQWLRDMCRKEAKHTIPISFEQCCVVADRDDDDWRDEYEHQERLWDAGRRFHERQAALTSIQKTCLLAEIAGESQVEVARRLGISPQSVNQHHAAAVAKMRAKEIPQVRKSAVRSARESKLEKQQHAVFLAGLLLHNIIGVEMGEIVVESIVGVPIEETERSL